MADVPIGLVGESSIETVGPKNSSDQSGFIPGGQPIVGAKVYFVMVGRLTTMAWTNWTVSGSPDFLGAQYTGPGVLDVPTIYAGKQLVG